MDVRQLARSDLSGVAEFCERARATDRTIEPFGERIAALAGSPRALLELWQVAVATDGSIQGVAFASARGPARDHPARKTDVYVTVAPRFRRRGFGTALCGPALRWAVRDRSALRARVPEGSVAGRGYLGALGFQEVSAQLLLTWSRQRSERPANASVRVKQLAAGEALTQLERLSRDAWAGERDDFAVAPDELRQLSREKGRLLLLADAGGGAAGYLSGVWLGNSLAIEEVAVLPDRRREGIGRALLTAALRDAARAVLSVGESNGAARALYRSFGFTQSVRRLVYELPHG